jgi:hypothetical protein
MKFTLGLGFVIVFGLSLSSCFDPPEYSVVPEIEFESLIYKDIADPSAPDSLLLFIKFQDGDGNLGLDPSELGCYIFENDTICYLEKFYYANAEGPLNYKVKRTNPAFSSLPDYVKPYDCINWELVFDNATVPQILDTVYFELNPDHYNIFVDFLVKQNDGSFQEFDWRTEFCTTYDGRFPILAKNRDLSVQNPVEGTLKYSMLSAGFKFQFSIKTLKLRIQIQDRLLNKSNIIETPEFQFK